MPPICKVEYKAGLGFWPLGGNDALVVVSALVTGVERLAEGFRDKCNVQSGVWTRLETR